MNLRGHPSDFWLSSNNDPPSLSKTLDSFLGFSSTISNTHDLCFCLLLSYFLWCWRWTQALASNILILCHRAGSQALSGHLTGDCYMSSPLLYTYLTSHFPGWILPVTLTVHSSASCDLSVVFWLALHCLEVAAFGSPTVLDHYKNLKDELSINPQEAPPVTISRKMFLYT